MFANCILFAIFCSMGTLVRRKKTRHFDAQKDMEFGLLMTDIPVFVPCKFEMYIYKNALVISENVCIAYLYVLSIYSCGGLKNMYATVTILILLLISSCR